MGLYGDPSGNRLGLHQPTTSWTKAQLEPAICQSYPKPGSNPLASEVLTVKREDPGSVQGHRAAEQEAVTYNP